MTDSNWLKIKDRKRYPKIAKILKVIFIIGVIIFIGLNAFIISSIFPIDIKNYRGTLDLNTESLQSNSTVSINSTFLIENDHINSISLRDVSIHLGLYSNETYIIGDTFYGGYIPRRENNQFSFQLDFNLSMLSEEKIHILNKTKSASLSVDIDFSYLLLKIGFKFQLIFEDELS